MKRGSYRPRRTIQEVKEIFSEQGYICDEKSFINGSQHLHCICPNHHKWTTTLSRFLYGYRCKKCSGKEKYSYEYVKGFFEKHKCVLLSTKYEGNNSRLKYQCSCGNICHTRFRNFQKGIRCNKCSVSRSMKKNKLNHNGKLYFQTDEFIENRKNFYKNNPDVEMYRRLKSKSTCMEKYGSESFLSSELGKNKTKETLMSKYGVSHVMQIPSSKEKFKETLMFKYGVPNLAFLSRPASKQSQILFWEIYDKLTHKLRKKCYFAELNNEFVISYQGQYFKFDFVNSLAKKAIEFNGSNFHPKPEQKDDDTGWCVFHPTKTVREARDYENKKYMGLSSRGFEILTVWDYEYRKDFKLLVEKCVNFIMPRILP